ncbi:DUF4345 family protein [Kribbella sp. CA-293567]|uniref:DUF4345 family protein n=1 Tax=Kribbella sp. CA-293567 TaxID=3002436 RepID=UPI0022DE2E41|nr:hypothetical protein [Kribbella sp. CA-293567]WBQ02183.1 hypothetical protein OX958_19550 [Kribbella sp. CA-293567]
MSRLLRPGLIVLGVIQLVVGTWTLFFPASFYNDVPTVDWTPPYSEHLFRDFGSTTLGIGIVVAAAAIWLERRLVIVALLAYLSYSVTHFAFHAHHLNSDSPGLSGLLLAFTILSVLIPAALLPAALRIRVT